MSIEVEIKARADHERLRERLRALGARLAAPRVLEVNDLFDDPAGSLRARGEILRIRSQGDAAVLTWKGRAPAPPGTAAPAGLKAREELETSCGDAAVLRQVLERLGYRKAFRYEKYRETWEVDGSEVVLDETPAGDFVEIEGDADGVSRLRRRLEIPETDVVGESYPALFRRLLVARGDPDGDMLFERT